MKFEWSDETVTKLRRLWAEGHSIREIHRKMAHLGVPSHHSVVGKAHRLGLPARGTPIKPLQPGQQYARRKRRPQFVLPALSNFETQTKNQPADSAPDPTEEPEPETDQAEITDTPIIERPAPVPGRCCYPIGHPRTPGFRFCGGKLRKPYQPYCAAHAAICFQPSNHEAKNDPPSAR
jgi:GcrA cell cycle regulator